MFESHLHWVGVRIIVSIVQIPAQAKWNLSIFDYFYKQLTLYKLLLLLLLLFFKIRPECYNNSANCTYNEESHCTKS
jgi:hypothetical protein